MAKKQKAHGRSIPGFDLHEALNKCQDLLSKFGGHAMAVGVTLNTKNIQEFKEKFEEVAREEQTEKIVPVIYIDTKVDLEDINKQMVDDLKLLEPYGEGNKMPIFLFKNLKIDSIRSLSEGKHLKMMLKRENNIINAIGFNKGNLVDEYRIGDKVDVVGMLEINSFGGNENLQINIKDIMRAV